MKYLIIPDLHGKDVWLNAINIAHEAVLFLGDYFDYFDPEKEIENFFEILNYKKVHSRTILLLGNHELSYISGIDQKYSGFHSETFHLISSVLEELISKRWLKVAHAIDERTICTHAGISTAFCIQNNIPLDLNAIELAQHVNDLFLTNRKPFALGNNHYHGNSIYASPLWIRPEMLQVSRYENLFQIVGHTQHESLTIVDDAICFTDVLNFDDTLFLTISEWESLKILGK